ncbi:hypothetical protein [Pedosphaera parvula]|uniref:TadE family protein n=1 Tax=Pedosphaera parvula (strain Ellin514) TaxID=320771 RepID=B9XSX7_PEDPL|nr:hypothetical protein [Pedosphaera parvula]EEF57061.1 hypothetical protein Cflav_PD0096 [Pedosphaera parvula Ellin514]
MKLNRSNVSQTSGIMLMECIIYVGMFFLFLGLAFSLFYVCWDNSKGLKRNADDIVRTLKAGERWREDVRTATGPLHLQAGDEEEILHIPQKLGEVLYSYSKDNVRRRPNTNAAWTSVLEHVKSSRMQEDRRQTVQAWRWEVELKAWRKSPRTPPLFSFEAVPNQHP